MFLDLQADMIATLPVLKNYCLSLQQDYQTTTKTNKYCFSVIFPCNLYKSLNDLLSKGNQKMHFRCSGLSVQGLQDSCSIHLFSLLNVISPTFPASQSASCSKEATSAVPYLVASSSWCVKTRMPLNLAVQLHSHIHKHKHYLPV